MNIVLGATGQIGFMLANNLFKKGQPVRAVVRDEAKAYELKKIGIEVFVADYLDKEALIKAFHGGKTAFLLTPESPNPENYLDEVNLIIDNYREAIQASGINKIVGLSSMGAQHESDTGNLVASYLLEHAFSGLNIEQIFVRPAYYYSNWIGYLELIMAEGILPTFFPLEMKLPMISPIDVAEFLADVMIRETPQERIYEVCGPQDYSSLDIVRIFEKVLNKNVTLQQILPDEWESTLEQAGFTSDGAKNFMLMTKAVIDGRTKSDTPNPVRLLMNFQRFLEQTV
ncbi:trkA-N domain protein [Clostridium argentinense CDC 2741]|uniref:TrkA-N domain protein n=1 Tax=Clostridium argentinense CDC 2741 TaxID=1418104 RepID=A0A0C1RCC2_9CLOT|nr:NmrA family NAD(P)-binding protein [Clostridium argentinense]ARC86213.1 nucleoside-diphosphate sugar epimerase [Clostridium argentinense]KIE47976.1 trkA-N domain protein [Clostridium argentinense CDC 2741]NFF40272.1 NAD-dependent epimerase/dehydratase family protein [Clostridium argentinense]NFP50081.1 NAD-dependent epimerase/dehydratase family protein [Clostridium argentinense]NFP74626.1 NAD-dependent epimerase/dehydratase family protein [Clostridium argentinense]